MPSHNARGKLCRRIAVAVANRSTRKAKRQAYKSRIDAICKSAKLDAPRLALAFEGHLFESGSKTLPLFGEDIVEAAEKVVRGSFVLFGKWTSVPNCLAESADQWRTDFLTGVRFPLSPYASICPKTDVADIKVPWEYGRMQYLLPLAAAYRMTGDVRYLDVFRHKVEGFHRANPLGTGVQWTCTMEVGIRVFNLLASYELLQGAVPADDALHALVAEMAVCHGEHIWANLETSAKLQENNHYIADLLGLATIASCYPSAPKSSKWGEYAKAELARCAQKQVLDDGCCFERSTRYTRLVGEMLFFAGKALAHTPYALPPEYLDRVVSLGGFLAAVTDDRGRSLQLGDNDSGRVVCVAPKAHDDLRLVGRLAAREMGANVGVALFPEEELLYGSGARAEKISSWSEGVKVFPDAGVALARLHGWSLGFYASDGFMGGTEAGHTHNDKLSVTLDVDGKPFFVDPGSGAYTRDTELRNALRGTSQHSTLWFEGLEQNELRGLFGFVRCGGATLDIECGSCGEALFEGSTDCWLKRLGVVHRRSVSVKSRQVQIIDQVEGRASAPSAWRSFILDPSVSANALTETRVSLGNGAVSVTLKSNAPISIREGLYSACYGSVEKTLILDIPYVPEERNAVLIRRSEDEG